MNKAENRDFFYSIEYYILVSLLTSGENIQYILNKIRRSQDLKVKSYTVNY